MGILILLVPILMVMGIIFFLNLVTNKDLKDKLRYRREFIDELLSKSAKETETQKKEAFLLAANYLISKFGDSFGKEVSAAPKPAAEPVKDVEGANETFFEEEKRPVSVAKSTSVKEQFISLDNINLLFYLGAFLVVVAAGVFVGFNYQSISGIGKTVFLAIFTLVFYGVGLLLYLKSQHIKEAGLVFTTIGLILAPLVGLAFYKFSAGSQNGNMIWFVTSLVVLGLYVLSFFLIKKTYISYLVTFVSLSLLESCLSIFEMPIQYFAWGMAIFSLLFLLVSRTNMDERMKKAYEVSANIFLPVSLLFSFTLVEKSLLVLGINFIIAAAYYILSSLLNFETKTKTAFFAVGISFLPIGLLLVMIQKEFLPNQMILVLNGLVLLYLVGYELLRKKLTEKMPLAFLLVGGFLALATSLIVSDDSRALFFVFLFALTVNAYAFYRERSTTSYLLGLISLFLLPVAISLFAKFSHVEYSAYLYLGLGALLVLLRMFISEWESKVTNLTFFAYLTAFLIAFFVGLSADSALVVAIISGILVLVFGILSYLEQQKNMLIPAVVVFYVAMISFGLDRSFENYQFVVSWMLSGLFIFGLSFLVDEARAKILAYGGLIGPFVGAVAGLGHNSKEIIPVVSLTVGGLCSLAQAQREKLDLAKYFAGGILVLSLLWFFHTRDISQPQAYTLPIFAYFGLLAYLRHIKEDSSGRDALSIISMLFLALPTFIQSLAFDGQIYGLVLGAESLALILIGMAIGHKTMLRFGIVALVIDVLYQGREFIAEIPKWLIIGLVGLIILVGATYLLQKSNKNK